MANVESLIDNLRKVRTNPQDYPHSVKIVQDLIPVFHHSITSQHHSPLVKLILQELSINDLSKDPSDEEIEVLAKFCGDGLISQDDIEVVKNEISEYRKLIEEIVRSLSLEGPGVCILEDVFSESYMDKFQSWVDEYLQQDTQEKKDHFAFGTNKRIWKVPEKLPSDLLYSYLQYDASCDEHRTPAFNHVIDRYQDMF